MSPVAEYRWRNFEDLFQHTKFQWSGKTTRQDRERTANRVVENQTMV